MAVIPLLTATFAAAPAQAQQYSTNQAENGPVIRGFNVDEVRDLRPGVELNFDLYGTPGGHARLYIAGANRNLNLTETEPGQYEGTYTIGTRDHIQSNSSVTANLRVGNRVTSGVLAESLLRGVGRHDDGRRNVGRDGRDDQNRRGELATTPHIERFLISNNNDLSAGNELNFSVFGTPGAKVDMTIAGARGTFFMPEVRPGEYFTTYTVRRADHVTPASVVMANLRINGRVATMRLPAPLLATSRTAPPQNVVRYCSNCATVEAVNVVQVNGDGNYLGAVGGGVVGALLGSQVGSGNGRTAAEIAGAVGGAYAGRNIQRNANRTEHYEVVIRYPNGGTQTVTYPNNPGFRVGEKVKINNGALTRDQ